MPPPVELPNVEFPRSGDGGYRCCRACCAAICDDAKAASRRCLPLPDGTVIHDIAVPLLDRASEQALRVVCRNSRAALADINPEWRPIWQWCSAIGYCIAPNQSNVPRARRAAYHRSPIGVAQQIAKCRCGLPSRVGRYEPDADGGPLTVTRQLLGTWDPATGTLHPAEPRILPRLGVRAEPQAHAPVAPHRATPAASNLPEQPSGSRRAWVPPPGWERPPRSSGANRPQEPRRTTLAALSLEPARAGLTALRPEDLMPWSPRPED